MKILLVEDDSALRLALEELLLREGYEVKKPPIAGKPVTAWTSPGGSGQSAGMPSSFSSPTSSNMPQRAMRCRLFVTC